MSDHTAPFLTVDGTRPAGTVTVHQIPVYVVGFTPGAAMDAVALFCARLVDLDGSVVSVSVGTDPDDEDELDLPYPLTLDGRPETTGRLESAIRAGLTATDPTPGRSLSVRVTVTDATADPETLTRHIAAGAAAIATPPKRTRRSLPTVKDLTAHGRLPVGSRLRTTVRGRTWNVKITAPGTVIVDDTETPVSLAQLTNDIQGSAQSAMRMWHLVRPDGRTVPLSQLRDQLADEETPP